MLKLKLQYFRHLMRRAHLLEKALSLEDRRQKKKGATEEEMVREHHWLNGHEFEQTLGDNKAQGSLMLQSMGSKRVGHNLVTEQQQQKQQSLVCCLNQPV